MIVDKGQSFGINYWITKTNSGWSEWYCAYVEKPNELADDEWEKVGFEPHGGITYSKFNEREKAYVWGWDYNHHEDYVDWTFIWEKQTTKLAKLSTETAINHIREDVKEYTQKLTEYVQSKEGKER